MFNPHLFSKQTKSILDYIRWEYDVEAEKERSTHPSRIMLNMTRKGQHCSLFEIEIQKGGKSLLYDVKYDPERQTLLSCVMLRLVS